MTATGETPHSPPEDETPIMYASMPEFGRAMKLDEARRRLAEERLRTDDLQYVQGEGWIARLSTQKYVQLKLIEEVA